MILHPLRSYFIPIVDKGCENVLQNVAACIYHSKDKIQKILPPEYGDPIFIPKFEKQTQIWIQQCISKSQHWEENLQQKNGIVSISSCGSRRFRWNKGK